MSRIITTPSTSATEDVGGSVLTLLGELELDEADRPQGEIGELVQQGVEL